MIKQITTLMAVALLVVSCDKKVDKLENNEEKVSYGIGMQISNRTKELEQTLPVGENISNDEVIAGMKEIFNKTKNVSRSKFLGMQMGMQIEEFIRTNNLQDSIDTDLIVQGASDNLNKKTLLLNESEIPGLMETYLKPLMEKAQQENQENATKRRELKAKENSEKSKKFLQENKAKSGVKTTPSGLQYEVIKEGDGTTKVTGNEIVAVKFTGKLIDGTIFDSTDKANGGKPVEFPVGQVIPGWQEGIKLMSKGGKYKLYVPAELAYGDQGAGAVIGPNEPLIFEVELVDVKPNNTPPPSAEPQMQLNANGQPAVPSE